MIQILKFSRQSIYYSNTQGNKENTVLTTTTKKKKIRNYNTEKETKKYQIETL